MARNHIGNASFPPVSLFEEAREFTADHLAGISRERRSKKAGNYHAAVR